MGLTIIAFAGSAIYGASLSFAFPQWRASRGALWIALSAGFAWCLFGPVLIATTGKSIRICIHACLVTMSYGEAVLLISALLNLFSIPLMDPFLRNTYLIGISNIVMSIVLARQFSELGVPTWKTLTAWMLALNGSGAIFFHLFKKMLEANT